MKTSIPLHDHLAYAATLLLGLGTAALAAGYPKPDEAHSGPGSFPFALGCLMVLVALLGWTLAARGASADAGQADAEAAGAPPARPAQTWVLAGLTAAYLLLLPALGFISATALLGAAALRALGDRDWPRGLAIGFLFAFALYGLFGLLMNVPLPKGVIG